MLGMFDLQREIPNWRLDTEFGGKAQEKWQARKCFTTSALRGKKKRLNT